MTLGATPTIAEILTELGDSYPVTIPNANWRALAGKPTGSLVIPTDFASKSIVTETDSRTTVATSHAAVDFGVDVPGRWVVILAAHSSSVSSPGLFPAATIGGVAATRINAASTGTGAGPAVGAAMFVAQPTGANGTVAVSWGGLTTSIIALRTITYNLSAAYASDASSSSGMPMSVNIPTKGLLIGFAARGAANEISWTNLTEQGSDSTDANSKRRSRGWDYNMALQAARSISVSPWSSTASNGINAAVVASFAKS
ncbi:hypothetical protein NL532_24030 [Mesorhizobium sp. C120A]|uniref:hypothetical protein n=1 Tax=unclassified Mesorhizobium TaxID=325217 RepID=UPI0003D0597B|nr:MULTISPECIES: hypothetical protein [unclassified Mesorhizobium]ESZ60643.1 hypothetical protein X728_14985 [Mesorhizobium sp. L103C120A0]WJI43678.1 hypothetical protein NL532_24030 [Mesorhizobium sp. C120A]